MKVGDLKKLIATIPDDVELVTESHSHEMREVDASDWFVARHSVSRRIWQFFSDEDLMADEEKVRALVIT